MLTLFKAYADLFAAATFTSRATRMRSDWYPDGLETELDQDDIEARQEAFYGGRTLSGHRGPVGCGLATMA